jgi:hypothetical protein
VNVRQQWLSPQRLASDFSKCTLLAAHLIPLPDRPAFDSSTAQFSPTFNALMPAMTGQTLL